MPKVGDTLGDFDLVREVGRGSMGVVYEARQRSLGRQVAVKVLTPAAAGDPVWIARFRDEAQSAARLSHPGILPIFAIGEAEAVPFFAMEYVHGRDVARLVEEDGPLEPREAARIARDAALALDHAHAAGLVHRDVKPGNLMVRDDGRVVVMDFGLAKQLGSGSLTATGSLVGTPYYMSPEQASGDRGAITARADVYGLGATLYEMVTGRPPFETDNPVALLRQIVDRDPTPPRRVRPSVPRDLETVILACVEKDPARRYVSARELAVDLDRFLAGTPVSRRRTGPIERARRWAARNPVAAAAVAGAVLLLGAGYAVFRGILTDREQEFATREEELLREIDLALEAGRRALEGGRIDEAEDAAERAATSEKASPAQVEAARRLLATIARDRFERARASGDLDLLDGALGRARKRRAPIEWTNDALPPAALGVRARPEGAAVEVHSLLASDAGPARSPAPIDGRELPLGPYRVGVFAPGRATAWLTLLLMEPGGRVDLDVALPSESDVPPDMAWFAGQVARAPGTVGAGRGGAAGAGSIAVDVAPFLLDRTEVTVEAYARFLASLPDAAERAAMTPAGWSGGEPPADSAALPVTGVTWTQADRYAAWAGKRLPTEREAQIAAFGFTTLGRGPEAPPEPARFTGRAVTLETGSKGPLPVDRADAHATPEGVRDLLGNAAEWTASAAPSDPWSVLVVGGSFRERLGRNAVAEFPVEASPSVGFRCARSFPGPFAASAVPPASATARRYRIDPDGSLAQARRIAVEAGASEPLAVVDFASEEKGYASYRVVAARCEGRTVAVERLAAEGPPAKPTHRTRLRLSPPVAPGERAEVVVEEVRSPPPDALFLRQGTRFLLEVPADGGVEVALPADATFVRVSDARAAVGTEEGRPTARAGPAPRERLRVEAVVPSARPADAATREALAAAERAVSALRTMDLERYLAWLAPEFVGERVGSRAEAEANFRDLARRVEGVDLGWTPWASEWEGDRVVVRWREERRLLHPRGGGAPATIGRLPEMTEFWCRRDGDAGRWLLAYEDTRSLEDADGALEEQGKVWRSRVFPGLSVGPPFGARVRPAPKGLADFAAAVPVADGVKGAIEGFRRVDPVSRTPALVPGDYEHTDFTVVSSRPATRAGGDVLEMTIVRTDGGVWSAMRRIVLRRGEAAVVVRAVAASPASREQALATLEAHRGEVDAFLGSVALPSGPGKPPR